MVLALAQPMIECKIGALLSINPVLRKVNLLKVGEGLDPIRHKPSWIAYLLRLVSMGPMGQPDVNRIRCDSQIHSWDYHQTTTVKAQGLELINTGLD